MSRSYVMNRRAESVEQTRARIVEAAMDLHGSVGPARTTISAIAERAGVERLTVYRHFPDEKSIFQACSAGWLERNPPPSLDALDSYNDPQERVAYALSEFYSYYERTRQMWERIYRDAPVVESLNEPWAAWKQFLAGTVARLIDGWPLKKKQRRVKEIAIAHALDFAAYASLTTLGADRKTALRLMLRMAGC